MIRTRNFFITFILLVAIVWMGGKLLLGFCSDKLVKNIQSQFPPGTFRYVNVKTSVIDRTVTINDVTLDLPELREPIKIESINIINDNFKDLMAILFKQGSATPPSALHVQLKSVTMPPIEGKYPIGLPCGSVTSLSPVEFIQMGYHKFVMDFDFSYQLNRDGQYIKLTLAHQIKDFIDYNVTFSGLFSIHRMMVFQPEQAVIPQFKLQVKSFNFIEKLTNYCALREKQTSEEYLAKLKVLDQQSTAIATTGTLGFMLDERVINALNDYVKNPRDFYFSINAKSGPVPASNTTGLTEQGVLKMLTPVLRVNNQEVPIDFQWMTLKQLKSKADTSQKTAYKPAVGRVRISMNELPVKAKDRRIELRVASGSVYVGYFKKVEYGKVYMRAHTEDGFMDVALDQSFIKMIILLPESDIQ